MLTKNDLDALRKLVREETRAIVREEVGNETQAIKDEIQVDINMSQMRIRNDIEELKDRIKNLEIRVTKMHQELISEIKMVTHFLDKDTMKTLKRAKRIEDHLRLSVS